MAGMDAATHVLLDLYAGQFAARHDGFVKDSGMHVNERLTPEVIASALRAGHSISGYMADSEQRTHIGAIDFDEGTEEDVEEVRKVLDSHSIRTLKVGSRRGFHLWTFISGYSKGSDGSLFATLPATTVTRALTHALRLATPDLFKSGKAEVFPKPTNGRWPGGTLRMPMMRHPKSGETYPVYDEHGGTLNNLMELMTYVAGLTTDHGAVNLFASTAPVEYPKGLQTHAQPRVVDAGASCTKTLAVLGVQAVPGKATHCPFHDDKRKSLSVSLDDERVWCKAPHCEAYNDGNGLGSIQLRQKVEARR